jgi:hypothetical protein
MFDIGHNYYVNDKIKNRWLSRQTLPYFFLSSTKFENQCAGEKRYQVHTSVIPSSLLNILPSNQNLISGHRKGVAYWKVGQ